MTYKLTDKKPTESGYYWAQIKDGDPCVVQVYYSDSSVYDTGDEATYHIWNFHKWSERIEEPADE